MNPFSSPPSTIHAEKKRLISQLALHVLTDHTLARGRDLLTVVSAALDGGATVIQLRNKTASTRTLYEEGLALRSLTRERGALLIVNDRIDVALAVDADGAHVGQEDMPGPLARQLLGPERILGISAANVDEARDAIAAGADYLGVGPIYATQSKSDAGEATGTALLTELTKLSPTPLVAIGGISTLNAKATVQAGAIGLAVISAIMSAEDVTQATRTLLRSVEETLAARQRLL